ncbi:MAG TPA: ABC transporter substrate-binding protein, partial [Acidimicrobiales bacterium]|nr:ABC transporter substrate-binding protein [Acidimicrobiales bacterium]
MLLVSAACGARWDEAQRESVLTRSTGGQQLAAGGVGEVGGATTKTTTKGGSGQVAGGVPSTAPGGGATGGGSTPAGGGSGGGGQATGGGGAPAAEGAKPCAAPSDAPGVTDTTITLGSISTLSGAVPGLGASSEGAARAYVAYRNATGGVCGRELVLKTADDGMDNARHRSIVTEMNEQVLGLVGGLAGGDAGSAGTVDELGMPVVNVAISKPFDDA